MYLLGHAISIKKRKQTFKVQGVVDGTMVFEATIEGLKTNAEETLSDSKIIASRNSAHALIVYLT